ncbi:MAG TPA: bifunctional phosphoribosyl-AMP cyclohydrolase/phosphoribosyl-ATP diphosphatase HisIE, partial [Thermoanaerobaculia bacterium]|nr:bifunctional phosphoribosyl-AMP cyclohydrolase/phosphoribosyl-ATP diphosphatase HisIE [Thermoanaerobaculia bacterium]
ILLTSVDTDGTRAGFDVDMLRAVRSVTPIPLVASGGAGRLEHFVEAVRAGGADAVLAASVFHDRQFSVGEVKRALAAARIAVRPAPGQAPFTVAFGPDGLVPVVVRDSSNGALLTLAYANEEAVRTTRETGFAHFYSRSRRKLWKKGETSGNVQRVVSIGLDCDADALVYEVIPAGPACHTGKGSCFEIVERLLAESAIGEGGKTPAFDLSSLVAIVNERKMNPVSGSYTNRLLAEGLRKIAKKVGEEGVEVALAGTGESDEALAGEIADLLYHLVVLMAARSLPPDAVERKLQERRGKRRDP